MNSQRMYTSRHIVFSKHNFQFQHLSSKASHSSSARGNVTTIHVSIWLSNVPLLVTMPLNIPLDVLFDVLSSSPSYVSSSNLTIPNSSPISISPILPSLTLVSSQFNYP